MEEFEYRHRDIEYRHRDIVPAAYDWRFGEDMRARFFANRVLEYVLFNREPETTPALWQDVEMYIRFRKRDVWSLERWKIENARIALMMYRVKYVIRHLSKAEILKIFEQFHEDTDSDLFELFDKKLHAPVEDLILVQEKRVITKNDIEKFDAIFEYPGWIEFDDEANEAVFEKILKNELSDEQIDYFLGASDDMKNYDKWFKVAKHILNTTENAHTFWTAGDILSIVWRAVPEDEKSQKWFRDQIFEIFWPRVGAAWPILHQEMIDFETDEEAKILKDSIEWLEQLSDLRERLPELGEDSENPGSEDSENPDDLFGEMDDLNGFGDTDKELSWNERQLFDEMDADDVLVDEMLNIFFKLCEIADSQEYVERLREIAENDLIPTIEEIDEDADIEDIEAAVERGVKHAEKYAQDLEREKKALKKLIK